MWLYTPPVTHAVFDTMTHAAGGDGTTFAATTSGANRYLIVLVTNFFGATGVPTGVTYNGVSMISLASNFNANVAASAWGLANPALGTNNVIVSGVGLAGAGTNSAFTFHNATNGVGTAAVALGLGSAASVTVTTAAGETICAATEDYSGTSMVGSGTFNELFNSGAGVSIGTQDGAVGTVAWTGTDTWSAVAVPVK